MSAPSDTPRTDNMEVASVLDRDDAYGFARTLERELAAMTARADDLAVECQAALHERDELREEVARLTKLNDLLMDDKHDWERQGLRRDLLEGMRAVKGRSTPRYFAPSSEAAITEAMEELAAVDAQLLKEQQP